MRNEILIDIHEVTVADAVEWHTHGYSVEKLGSYILLTEGGAW